MKIGLVNPNKNLKHPAVHLGLGYLASFAQHHEKGLEFSLLDTRVATTKEIDEFIHTDFELVAITASAQVFLEAADFAQLLKEKHPNLKICLGGSHPSTVKEEAIIGFPFDFAARGEGEITFLELIRYIKGTRSNLDIEGLIYKNKEGKIICNPPRAIIADIDSIPFPAYNLFKMNRYPQHRMTTTRGCPFSCVFCNSHSIWTSQWRKRSPQNLIDEMSLLINKYGYKNIIFNDDSFNIDLKRVDEFCDKLIATKMDVLWTTSVRADRITAETAAKMKKAGCYNVSIGVESANDEMLKRMKKNTTKAKIYQGIQTFRQAGIDVMGQFMIGNPGDSLEKVKESIEFAKTSNLTGVEFYTALPYPDSDLFYYVQEQGKMLTDAPCHQYHTFNPRIIFETPEFPYEDRKKAIELAMENGYYNALSTDSKSFVLDFGKKVANSLQIIFGERNGNKAYLVLRKLYNRYR